MNLPILLRTVGRMRSARERFTWLRERLLQYQSQQLAELLRFARERSPFYQNLHRGLKGRDLAEYPIVTKPQLMDAFDRVVTEPEIRFDQVEDFLAHCSAREKFMGKYIVTSTSGTTGRRGIFLNTDSEWADYTEPYTRPSVWARSTPGVRPGRRTAHITSKVPWTVAARAAAFSGSRLLNNSIGLDPAQSIETMVLALNEWQPRTLTSYASAARRLALEQLEGRLNIKPEIVITTAERLTDESRTLAESAWGKVVFNSYASTETPVAGECEQHRGLHLYEDVIVPEVVDDKGCPVPPGEFGERLLVTVLFRRTIPLIRYEISDMVRLSRDPCPCGRPFALIDAVMGRHEEVLYFDGVDGGQVAIDPVFFEPILGGIKADSWQVVQRRGDLMVRFCGVPLDFDCAAVGKRLNQELTKMLAVVSGIEVVIVDSIPRGATGKAPLITVEH